MKNFEKIKEIYLLFNTGDVRCYVELRRLRNNFEIDDDEFTFDIKAESDPCRRELAEKLLKEGKAHLIGDERFIETYNYLKEPIKTIIHAKNRFGNKTLFNIALRLDEDGEIAAITCRATQPAERAYVKKVVERWLNREFGEVNE